MPIYSPTGFLDITNATLRTSNLEAQNFRLNGGNIYVTSELTTDELLNLDNVVNAGNATSNTVQFTNLTTGLVADSNIVVTGNVTAGSFLGDGSGLTSIPPSAITGTLSQWSDGTNSDVYIASNVGIGNVHTLTSNTLQVGANLYVRDADANVLTVTGNVAADYFEGDGSKLTGISSNLEQIANNGNVTSNTVQFTNATTGFVTTSNIEVGGALKINTITAAAYHSLQAVTNVGNVTSNTVQFSNATTGLVTTGNVEVGRDLSVTGNLTVLGTRTIVDTDTLRVKDPIIELGKDNPGTGDLGLVMTRPSGSSNVAMIFDESTDTLEIGYTEGSASDTTINMDSTPLSVNVNGNVSVGKELTVTGNVAVGTDTLFVDSVNDRVGIGTTNPSAPLDVPGGIASPGFQAQYGLTCAGLVTWTGTHLSWVHRIIAIPVEKNEFGASGFLDMYVPTSGTSITHYDENNTITTKATTADGFPIEEWEALWYVVTPGQSTSTVNSQYVITNYGNSLWKPNSNWLLLAVRSGETSQQPYLKFIPTNGNYYTWIAPTFATNWGNYGGSYNTAGYYRDGDGIVYLRGLVTGGSYGSNETLFTLPAGFRPESRELFSVISDQAHGRLDITADGQVIPYVGSSWISLDGISFKAVQ